MATHNRPVLIIRIAFMHTIRMIKSFRHKGLERFFLTGSKAGVTVAHAEKLQIRLTALHAATGPDGRHERSGVETPPVHRA
jgi:RelE-like toxin of type II toxin-antitoxin system HigB